MESPFQAIFFCVLAKRCHHHAISYCMINYLSFLKSPTFFIDFYSEHDRFYAVFVG